MSYRLSNEEETETIMKNITVFGGSRPKPGEDAYQNALKLGRLLGEAGYTVLTGGYIGTMEAVSRGAKEAGAHVIGVTSEQIEAYRPGKANAWVQEERRCTSLRERIFTLMDSCDAAFALPGGIGTLTEIAFTWNHLLTGAIRPRPLILIGPGWRATFNQFFQSLGSYVPGDQRRWITFASDVDVAMEILQGQKE